MKTSYYKGLIAETNARDEAERAAKRLRDETTFCHHGKTMVVQCTACEYEEGQLTVSDEIRMPNHATRNHILEIVDEAIKDYASRSAPQFTLIENIAEYLTDEDMWVEDFPGGVR